MLIAPPPPPCRPCMHVQGCKSVNVQAYWVQGCKGQGCKHTGCKGVRVQAYSCHSQVVVLAWRAVLPSPPLVQQAWRQRGQQREKLGGRVPPQLPPPPPLPQPTASRGISKQHTCLIHSTSHLQDKRDIRRQCVGSRNQGTPDTTPPWKGKMQ